MAFYPFQIVPQYTGLVLAFKNQAGIADRAAPRTLVAQREFKVLQIPKGQGFTIPDAKVGRTSAPNRITRSTTSVDSSVVDYGLEEAVPQDDIDAAAKVKDESGKAIMDPQADAALWVAYLLELGREKRVADMVFNANNYAANNKVQLAGNDQWSDLANSDPIDDILTGINAMLMRPNVMILGAETATKLQTHPKILKAVRGNDGDTGIVPIEAIRMLFNLEEVLVGQGKVNTAKPGQAVTLANLWGKHCSLVYRNTMANTQHGMTFAMTPQYGQKVASTRQDPDIGMRGGIVVRVGESVNEYVMSDELGYYIEDAVA